MRGEGGGLAGAIRLQMQHAVGVAGLKNGSVAVVRSRGLASTHLSDEW